MRVFTTSGTVLAVWASAVTAGYGQQPAALVSSKQAFQEGIALHDKGDYAGAIRTYLSVPSSDTAYVSVLGELGLSYLLNKQYPEAVRISRQAIDLGQHEAQPYIVLAEAEEKQDHREAALKVYAEGLKRMPYNPALWYSQGVGQDALHQPQAALASWTRSLELKPLYAPTHHQLAWLAIEQGQPARSLISLLTALALSPDGEGSQQMLLMAEQIASNSFEVDANAKIAPFVPNEVFQDLDLLLNSKVALRKDYTSKVKFDANIVKQAQLLVEKFPASRGDQETDLWLRAYGPLVDVLRRDDNLTAFTYLVLSSASDKRAAQWLKSNKAKVERMSEAVSPAIMQIRTSQLIASAAQPQRRTGWFDEGVLYGIGEGEKLSNGDARLHGPWIFIDEAGSITSEGSFNEAGKRTGHWRTYHPNGRLNFDTNYDSEGRLDGHYLEYHDNGALSVDGTYKAGELDGAAKLFHYCGELSEQRSYQVGNRQGEVKYYYPDGRLRLQSAYQADKKQGSEIGTYPDGTPEYRYGYANDKKQGPFEVYYADKTLERKGTYEQDELHGLYSDFHPNGKPASTGAFDHGRYAGNWKVYYATGKLSIEKNYDSATGELHGSYKDYDSQGRLNAELTYDQGRVTRIAFFDEQGKVRTQTDVAKKGKTVVKGLRTDGSAAYTGSFLNGKQDGEWRWNYRNGNVQTVRHYTAGKTEGLEEEYFSTGRLRERNFYKDGSLEGTYEKYYLDGQLQRAGNYQSGQQQGQWKQYYADGKLSEEYNILNDQMHGAARSYSPGGQLTQERWMEYGRMLQLTAYDSVGHVVDRIVIEPTTKSLTLHYPGGKPRMESNMLCYDYQGNTSWRLPNGKTETQYSLDRGDRNGQFRAYSSQTGKLISEGFYRNGKKEGEWKAYYPSGVLMNKVPTVMMRKRENG
ncbi:hypothetical protein [Hymenobacter sp. AT01-02]|uniref:hypothetical protein n=1 Tax=Hymenobacter sp. AT01-02 TaxID=1571877 RepID=UPI0005F0CDE1|nr:hypothetical protein [Hymenobacter sp. AT01-02]